MKFIYVIAGISATIFLAIVGAIVGLLASLVYNAFPMPNADLASTVIITAGLFAMLGIYATITAYKNDERKDVGY